MAKLYFKGSDVAEYQELNKDLLDLIEHGMTETEKQRSFRSFYDIEVMGVAVYYKKNWRYERVTQEDIKKAAGQS